ncbi:PACE efflux transporter [Pseudaminobacter salicylatoxidans]|uniref:PACE efflux transporter n=1 Tax=Pseudaminobacter salicylatoxidans TaxID=93369 RepID=UPI00047455BF|nr:PACE efflux transporter [Pseudaminobacter salicylatoxidans]
MTMRSFPDRVRHALMFEIIGLAIITPAAAYLYDKPIFQMGVVSIGSATIATIWTFVFNLGFDHAMRRMLGHTAKCFRMRLAHTVLFELGLLILLLPPIAWYLNMTLIDTLILDLGIVAFYLIYNFAFNVAYDRVFPVPAIRHVKVTP